ncbi:protein transport protein Sec23A [Trypanosoma cruzi]|nr:protein transport protein Sec23A [Trypanosoma cruzi]
MYHLRRSAYLQVFNCSPDETATLRLMLLKSSVQDSIIQIQPTLYSYRMDAPPQPVLLDSAAIQPDNILLLDTFFEVLVHLGSTIAAWRRAGYAELEEYAYFKEFLQVPVADAEILVAGRYPTPRFIYVCQDDPDARILYNRINPSRSYGGENDQKYGTNEGELVYTDDASLGVFMEHLKKLAVSQ